LGFQISDCGFYKKINRELRNLGIQELRDSGIEGLGESLRFVFKK
jgi:hypothetical protein